MLPRIDQAQADPLVDELAEPAARDCPPPTLRCAARPSTSAPFVVVRCARRRAIRPRFRRSTKRDRPIESRRPRPDCLVTLRLSVVFDSRRRRRPAAPGVRRRVPAGACGVRARARARDRAEPPADALHAGEPERRGTSNEKQHSHRVKLLVTGIPPCTVLDGTAAQWCSLMEQGWVSRSMR